MAGEVSGAVAADPVRPGAPTALYRRYRPATFAELKGQDHVTEPLRQALRSGRVHHAYLFSGPRGCGKTSSARILARSLNCERGPTPDPCGVCASCVALSPSGPGSIDVIEIDAASHGGVDDARDLRERAFYAPVSGRFKIYIVDEAHMVTREGFNALLKLVEEPPPHLKFVFATTEPEKVIATIRSRTHHYPFRLMPPAVLRGLLEEILASEGVRYEPAVLPVVVRAGAGSARDALSILDQLLAGSDESGLTYEAAVALLGYTDDNLLDEVAAAFAASDGAAVFRAVNRIVEGGHDPRRFAADLLDRFRDLIVLAAVPDAAQTGLLDVPADRLERMRDQAASFDQGQLARAAEIINGGLVEMRGATSPRLQLELICAKVLLPAAADGERALLARVERLERQLGSDARRGGQGNVTSGPVLPVPGASRVPPGADAPRSAQPGRAAKPDPAPKPGPAAHSVPGSGAGPRHGGQGAGAATTPGTAHRGGDVVRERWPEILEAVRHQRKVAWILLSNATVDALEDGVLTLRFAREGEARGFAGSDYGQDLGQVLEAMLGITPQIRAVSVAAQGGEVRPHGGDTSRGAGGGGSAGMTGGPGGGGSAGMTGGPAGQDAAGVAGGAGGAAGEDQFGPGAAGKAQNGAGAQDATPGGVGGDSGAVATVGRPGAGESSPARADRGAAGRASHGGANDPEAFSAASALTGMDLIQHTLGGQVIEEIGDP